MPDSSPVPKIEIFKHGSKMKRIAYVCSKCSAEDSPRFFMDEPHAKAINCWKCGAGRNIQVVSDMLAANVGMFPKRIEIEDPDVVQE